MIFNHVDMKELLRFAQNKTLICFGAGYLLQHACRGYEELSFFDKIDLIADNNVSHHSFKFEEYEKPVYPLEECLTLSHREPAILITISDYIDVVSQLNNIKALDSCYFFLYPLVQSHVAPYVLPVNRTRNEPPKIPKTIHYCWFGGKPVPEIFCNYMESWKKFCPDYEIVRWDESNNDYKKNEYMYDAYKNQKWGFVPDYARLDIIYRYGGVYLDTDVELIKNIDDLRCDDAFCGFTDRTGVGNGLGFGAVPGFPLIMEQLKIYDDISFINPDGTLNMKAANLYQTELFCEMGLKQNNTLQKLKGMKIYPSDVLLHKISYGAPTEVTDNTYAVHHAAGTWFSDYKQERVQINIQAAKQLLSQWQQSLL